MDATTALKLLGAADALVAGSRPDDGRGPGGAAPSARRHLGIGFAVPASFCAALDRRQPAATDRPAGGADQAPVAGEATCRGGIGAGHTRLGAEPGSAAAGDGVKPEAGRHLGVAGLVESGEVVAASNAMPRPPASRHGCPMAPNQLPPDILTEDGEAEANRPAEQRLVGIAASTWAADEPSGKHTDAHQHTEHAQLARGDL
jgi:hypothetical protein